MSNNLLNGSISILDDTFKNLTYLDLSSNKLSKAIPAAIGNLTKLMHLDLAGIEWTGYGLTGTMPFSFKSLTQLTYLDVFFNLLNGTIPSSIGNLTKLVHLDLSGNAYSSGFGFSGTISSLIGNLIKLTHLDLSLNKMSGSIPSSIGNLNKLEYLNFWGNRMTGFGLTGSLPSSIGNLIHLTTLKVAQNSLNRTIPSAIGNLIELNSMQMIQLIDWYNAILYWKLGSLNGSEFGR